MLLIEILDFPDHIVVELLAALVVRSIDRNSPARTEDVYMNQQFDVRMVTNNLLMIDQHKQRCDYHEGFAYQSDVTIRGGLAATTSCVCYECGSVTKYDSPVYFNYTRFCPKCTPNTAYTYVKYSHIYWPSYFTTLHPVTQKEIHSRVVQILLDREVEV